MPALRATLPALVLLAIAFAGCSGGKDADGGIDPRTTYAELGFDGTHWPDLHGQTVTILDHGAFDYVFDAAKPLFDELTNGSLQHIPARDTGDALNRAIREKDAPSFDIIYGLDNAYLSKAVDGGALRPYTPLLASRVNASYVFFGDQQPWPATPADHGYIAVNVDPASGLEVNSLQDVLAHADQFATPDPRFSSPGLGFLLATVATFPDGAAYDWQAYWSDLLDAGALVTTDWSTAYEDHFTGGYGVGGATHVGGRPLVTSYTTSPAYERYFGANHTNGLVLAPNATFHQVETAAIAANAPHLAGAQAFLEFVLTDAFQGLHAANNAVYPVVDGIDVAPVFNGTDPAPGTFQPAALPYSTLAGSVAYWVREWTDLYEAHQA